MAEFDLIKQYFSFSQSSIPASLSRRIVKGIGDDCALIKPSWFNSIAISSDSLVESIHFFSDANPQDIAYKALASNVSDLAAMGAMPLGFTLAISLPTVDHQWLQGFSDGLQAACSNFAIPLIGGDTTKSSSDKVTLTITVFGEVSASKAMLRNQAKLNDDIWVTGHLGDAAYALELHNTQRTQSQEQIYQKLHYPESTLAFSQAIKSLSRCAIDVSDGLLADLGHIIVQSGCGAKLNAQALPISKKLEGELGREAAWQYALCGGDDYQLCFTANPSKRATVLKIAEKTHTKVSRIGRITESGLKVLSDGEPIAITRNGWQHFSRSDS